MPTVRGRREMDAFFADLPNRLTNVIRGAARAGGEVIADDIKDRTPSDTVREAVRISTKVDDGQVRVTIDLKKGWARPLANWLEYGTSAHFISVDDSQRDGKSVGKINETVEATSLMINGKFVGNTVFHPGARPHPAFRPALDTQEAAAINAAQSYITTRLARNGIATAGGDA